VGMAGRSPGACVPTTVGVAGPRPGACVPTTVGVGAGGMLVLVGCVLGGTTGQVGGKREYNEGLSPHALGLPVPSLAKVYTVRIEAGGYSTCLRLTSAFAREGVHCTY